MKQIIYFESALKPKPADIDGLELHAYMSVLDKGMVSGKKRVNGYFFHACVPSGERIV